MTDRFAIAQDGPAPTAEQLAIQRGIRTSIATVADELVRVTSPSREQSLALTKLEEALMWAGKAIFRTEAQS